MSQFQVTLPDGSVQTVAAGASPLDVARSISPRLADDALVAKVNGSLWDLKRPFEADASLQILTPKSPEALEVYRHSTAHLLAAAVLDRDDELDALKRLVAKELMAYMQRDKATVAPSFELILISRHLERVGDLAVNIAEAAKRYASHPPIKRLIDIPTMGTLAQAMLRDALDAFVLEARFIGPLERFLIRAATGGRLPTAVHHAARRVRNDDRDVAR